MHLICYFRRVVCSCLLKIFDDLKNLYILKAIKKNFAHQPMEEDYNRIRNQFPPDDQLMSAEIFLALSEEEINSLLLQITGYNDKEVLRKFYNENKFSAQKGQRGNLCIFFV